MARLLAVVGGKRVGVSAPGRIGVCLAAMATFSSGMGSLRTSAVLVEIRINGQYSHADTPTRPHADTPIRFPCMLDVQINR
jgi:hypothetical protein